MSLIKYTMDFHWVEMEENYFVLIKLKCTHSLWLYIAYFNMVFEFLMFISAFFHNFLHVFEM